MSCLVLFFVGTMAAVQKQYSGAQLTEAIEAVTGPRKCSRRKAADEYGVPRATLNRYCRSEQPLQPGARSGPNTVLKAG